MEAEEAADAPAAGARVTNKKKEVLKVPAAAAARPPPCVLLCVSAVAAAAVSASLLAPRAGLQHRSSGMRAKLPAQNGAVGSIFHERLYEISSFRPRRCHAETAGVFAMKSP